MTKETLDSLFLYCENTGNLYRKTVNNRKQKVGEIVGYLRTDGYIGTKINNKSYRVHRLILCMVSGVMPKFVDHINHNRSDNSLKNLRAVSRTDNGKNQSQSKSNTSGVTGVDWLAKNNMWVSRIYHNNRRIYLGSFAKFSEAVDARKLAEVAYGYHKNHGEKI